MLDLPSETRNEFWRRKAKKVMMQSYPSRVLDKRLQED